MKKAINIVKKHLKDFTWVDQSKELFSSDLLSSLWYKENDKVYSKWNKDIERLSVKLRFTNRCIGSFDGKVFFLKTFSLRPTKEKFEYLYHKSDTEPNIILTEGLRIRYSLSGTKPFNASIFLSSDNRWFGKYTYRVKIKQQLYYDTNLNWQMRKDHSCFCCLQNISAKDIELIAESV